MIGRRTLVLAACCLAVSVTGYAATVDDLERQIRELVRQRQTSQQERSRLVAEAASLADVIAVAQASRGGSARASGALERQLREFDRVAGQLDAVDRTLKSYDTSIGRLRRTFDVELDRLAKGLAQTDARGVPAGSAALEAARQRIDELVAPAPPFRPLLIVRADPTDTLIDLDQKLAVLTEEHARGTEALEGIKRDLSVFGGRAIVTRRLLDGLESTARAAPPDLRLVQRQVDEVQSRLQSYDAKLTDLGRLRDSIVEGLAAVEKQQNQCRALRNAQLPRG